MSSTLSPLMLVAFAVSTVTGASVPEAETGHPWSIRALDNGVRAVIVHVPDATAQTLFTFVPLGLQDDDADHAQYAHLVEHMLIRSTDPDTLTPSGLRLNGETTAATMRLESIGDPAAFASAADRHARWLSATSFSADGLEVEKGRIEQEESWTVSRGYTGKWATAAWNQLVRHGREHAAVHGDVAAATVEELSRYVEARVPVGEPLLVVAVGPVSAAEVAVELERTIGALPRRVAAPVPAEAKIAAGDHAGTWDFAAHHFMEWYAVPSQDATDRLAGALLGQLLATRLGLDVELRKAGVNVTASTDLSVDGARFLVLSGGTTDARQLDTIRGSIRRALREPIAARPDGFGLPMLVRQMQAQVTELPDFALLRRTVGGRGSVDFVEAQVMLSQVSFMMTSELATPADASRAFARLDDDRIRDVAGRTITPERRGTLTITPAEPSPRRESP